MGNIIPPHITLVSPLSDIPEEQLLEHVGKVAKALKAFPINLAGLTKSNDDYLFLLVKQGNNQIIDLHNKLSIGNSEEMPFVPHVTLGYFKKKNYFNQESFEGAFKEAEKLDIDCIFDSITVIKGDGLTPAEIIKTFKLS